MTSIITVTYPNGGENLQRGTTYNITWSSINNTDPNVKIELLNGGIIDRIIVDSVPNNGSYSWTIPIDLALDTDYKIRITSITDTQIINSGIYLNTDEITDILNKIDQEPWLTAYNQFITDANNQLNTPIKSVTYGGTTPPSGDNHDYYSGAPGCTPTTCRADYTAAMAVSKAVRELGLAYALTNDNRYADKAIQLINGWCIDSGTKMTPRWSYTGQNGQIWIELYITMPAMFYGANLIWNYSGWNSSDRTAFKNWVATLLSNLGHGLDACNKTQNYDSWKMVFVMSAAIITDNQSEFDWAVDKFKNFIIDCQQDSNGSFYRERTRSEGGWAYSMYALKAWISAAEIARHKGIDLYGYSTPSGKGLELGLDFHAPYVVNPNNWPYTKCTVSNCRPIGCDYDSGGAFYELAYRWKQKNDYMNAITNASNGICSRQRYDNRTMGYVTLTHGI